MEKDQSDVLNPKNQVCQSAHDVMQRRSHTPKTKITSTLKREEGSFHLMNAEQEERSFVVECQTPQGWKIMAIPIRLLATDPARVIRILTEAGVEVASGMDDHVIQYLTDSVSRLEGQSQ